MLALFIVSVTTDVSLAQQRRGGAQDDVWTFLAGKYDTNNDGKLSKKEYDRGAETFARFDRNKDGVISAEDWSNEHFSARNSRGSRGRGRIANSPAPEAGELAPEFNLANVNNPAESVRLSSFAGKKPVALIFGSCS